MKLNNSQFVWNSFHQMSIENLDIKITANGNNLGDRFLLYYNNGSVGTRKTDWVLGSTWDTFVSWKSTYTKNIKMVVNLPNAISIGGSAMELFAMSSWTNIWESLESVDLTLNAPKLVSAGDSFLSRLIVWATNLDDFYLDINLPKLETVGNNFLDNFWQNTSLGSVNISLPSLISWGNYCLNYAMNLSGRDSWIRAKPKRDKVVFNFSAPNATFGTDFMYACFSWHLADEAEISVEFNEIWYRSMSLFSFDNCAFDDLEMAITANTENLWDNFLFAPNGATARDWYRINDGLFGASTGWTPAKVISIKNIDLNIQLPNAITAGDNCLTYLFGSMNSNGSNTTTEKIYLDILAPNLVSVGHNFLSGMSAGAVVAKEFSFNPDGFTRKLTSVGNGFMSSAFANLGGELYKKDLSFKFDELVVAGDYFLDWIYSNSSVGDGSVYGDIEILLPKLTTVGNNFLQNMCRNINKGVWFWDLELSYSIIAPFLTTTGNYALSGMFHWIDMEKLNMNIFLPNYRVLGWSFFSSVFNNTKAEEFEMSAVVGAENLSSLFYQRTAQLSNDLTKFKGVFYFPYAKTLSNTMYAMLENKTNLTSASVDVYLGGDSIDPQVDITGAFTAMFRGCNAITKPNFTITPLYASAWDKIIATDRDWMGQMFLNATSLQTLNSNFPSPDSYPNTGYAQYYYIDQAFNNSWIQGLPSSFALRTTASTIQNNWRYLQAFNNCPNLDYGTVELYFAKDGTGGVFWGTTLAKPTDTVNGNPTAWESVYVSQASHSHIKQAKPNIPEQTGKFVSIDGDDININSGLVFSSGRWYAPLGITSSKIGDDASGFVATNYHGRIVTGNGIVLVNNAMSSATVINEIDGKSITHSSYAGIGSVNTGYIAYHIFYADTSSWAYLIGIKNPWENNQIIQFKKITGLSNAKTPIYKALVENNKIASWYGAMGLSLASICSDWDLRVELIVWDPKSLDFDDVNDTIDTSSFQKIYAWVSTIHTYRSSRWNSLSGNSWGVPRFYSNTNRYDVRYISGTLSVGTNGWGLNGWSSVGTLGLFYGISPSNAYFASGKDSRLLMVETEKRNLADGLEYLPISPWFGGMASDGTDLYIRNESSGLDVVISWFDQKIIFAFGSSGIY